jgi:phosphoglycolate phosphatase-like HAD superfamily hydrolase
MLDLKKYKQVVFDCDGVILDSNNIKSKAFEDSLKGENDQLISEFIDYHKKNGGVSRFVKFEYFFKVLKNQKNYQKDLNIALKKYSKLSYQGLLKCEMIPGVENILNFLYNQNVDCFVISGGEQSEVMDILEKRGLSVFFKDIYGSPITKKEHLKSLQLSDALYFGDAWSDYDAAKDFGIDFIYISNTSEWQDGVKFCKENQLLYYSNFNVLKYF